MQKLQQENNHLQNMFNYVMEILNSVKFFYGPSWNTFEHNFIQMYNEIQNEEEGIQEEEEDGEETNE